MNKLFKPITAMAASALLLGTSVVSSVIAWGDNAGGRKTYTCTTNADGTCTLNADPGITFNSITNNPNIGDERNFVGARLASTGNNGKKNVWNANEITAVDGETYIIRLYVHNNSPKGTNAIAKDVTTYFSLPTVTGTSLTVQGKITSSNANPTQYWDDVVFKSSNGQSFYLDYIEGSALLENNGIGANGGLKLSDNIITKYGDKIGYDSLNGQIPGCFNYAAYITIKVKAVYTDQTYKVEKTVRKSGEKTWAESINANVNDEVEFQIHYKNTTAAETTNVMVLDNLPTNMEYVKGSTVLYNATNPKGIARDDTITTTGVNIGGYAVNGDAYVRFKAKVTDKSLVCGTNQLVNWGQVSVNKKALSDSADVMVSKKCDDPVLSFTVNKTVRNLGQNTWVESVNAAIDETVEFRVDFKNTGTASAENVIMTDTLPQNMEYVKGSTVLYNAANINGKTVGDELMTTGLNIGNYAAQTEGYITFRAKVIDQTLVCNKDATLTNKATVATAGKSASDTAEVKTTKSCTSAFKVEKTVRNLTSTEWVETVNASIDETVEFRIYFKNTGELNLENVVLKDQLPANMEYVAGTTTLYNSANAAGKAVEDTLTTTGLNIGNYDVNADGYVTFRAKVVDNSLICNKEATLTNKGTATVNKLSASDTASVLVSKTCKDPEPTPEPTPEPEEPKFPEPTPEVLPKTGAASIMGSILGAGSLVTSFGYYVASRKQLRK